MQPQYDVIVIGGGASGMMAAGRAAERGRRVLLLEKNSVLGKKLAITGGGRCNICNAEEDVHRLLHHYGAAEKFLHSSFAQFGVKEAFEFFSARQLPLKVEARQRAFPESERAADVVAVFQRSLEQGTVTIRTGGTVSGLIRDGGRLTGVLVDGETVSADAYILATGGASHPYTGSTGDGFRWLADIGHTIHNPTPSVVPIAVADRVNVLCFH
jgi:predicted Rossmann fold flavoprotein